MLMLVIVLVVLVGGFFFFRNLSKKQILPSELHSWETPECLSLVQIDGRDGFQSIVPGLNIDPILGVWTYNGSPPIEIGCAKRFNIGKREVVIVVLYIMEIPYQPQTAFGPNQRSHLKAYAEKMISQARKSVGGFVPNVYSPDDCVIYSPNWRAQDG